ncbi:MAG TPA: hypothetical protein VGI46_17500 [Candidatus Acidoferrum sp.]|jgi:hypothetical protein
MLNQGEIIKIDRGRTPWFCLSDTPRDEVEEWLEVVEPIYEQTQEAMFKQRLGQVLEIAVLKALKASARNFLGDYPNLDEHDDSELYDKIEPPRNISGNKIEKGPLDYVVFEPGGRGGIEVKNYRTWIYPDKTEVRNLLWKCGDVGAVPVLMARRLPYITFRLLNLSGCIVYQHYNQLYANADKALAEAASDKDLLGYHDVRVGSEPDKRMNHFVSELLPGLVGDAQNTFERFRDLHLAYGREELDYTHWVREVMTRSGRWQQREPLEGGEWEPDVGRQ